MSEVTLSWRDRLSLVGRAFAGSISLDPSSVGGRLLSGVVSPGGAPPARGTREYLGAYSTMPWLRAVASRVSFDIAATDWKLLVERKPGGIARRNRMLQKANGIRRKTLIKAGMEAGEIEEITNHPALDLLDNANSMQTGLQMRRVTQLHLDLVGESFWLLERGALNQPIAVWPIPPSWVLGTPTPRRPAYRVSFKGWQGEVPETEMICFSDVDPLNPYGRGTGTARALADELETDEYASKHVKAFFYNNARPDLVVYPVNGGSMTEDDVERVEEQWTAQNQGFWRAFKPFFLRREVGIKELDQGNFRAQQMVPLREFERDSILQVFGVSPETLGILGPGSNRATVTMGDQIYGRRVLIPRLELIRSVLQERLMPEFDERLIVDYESPVTKDREMELDAAKAAPWALTINEWRCMQGLEPLEVGGDVHLVPPTSVAARFDGEMPEPQERPEPEEIDDEEDDEEDDDEDEDEGRSA